MLERDPHRVAEEGQEYVRLGAMLELVKDGAYGQFTFQSTECGFGFGELDVTLPEMFRVRGGQVGA